MVPSDSSASTSSSSSTTPSSQDRFRFWACFLALIATAFGFIIRAMVIDEWAVEFSLSETQKGEIFGVGLWPFAISIVLFSLVIDRIGYGKAMVFAFVCHVTSALLTIFADGYWTLYAGTFVGALGNGTVEAVINPVVATLFVREKTKWLNILHAGWPGGLVLGGLIAIGMGTAVSWEWKVGLVLIPTVLYGILMIGRRFPINERVAAGVSYRDMLAEIGFAGVLIVVSLMVLEVGRVFGFPTGVQIGVIAAVTVVFATLVRSPGRPMFIFLLLVMIPLATTELGTDSWITPLMGPEMAALGLQAGWVLVYTSAIMCILRFCAGPIVKRLNPLGLLAASATLAALGLVALSKASGGMILVAATLYGVGKTFFWPTTLGVVAERFPRGGAMTLNAIAGVGMLGVGVVGAVFLGAIQDQAISKGLASYDESNKTALHAEYVTETKESVFGTYTALDSKKRAAAGESDAAILTDVEAASKKGALSTVAIFPVIMLVCYIGLMLYFRRQGGYRAVELET